MDKITEILGMITQAAKSDKSEDAMRWTQAAVNAANALRNLSDTVGYAVTSSPTNK